ncbi:MAG TPA: hypothetical protein VGH43_09810 [Jatrophihabitans sp.]
MSDYSGWDLKYLKSAIEGSDISWLEQSAQQFDRGSAACAQAAADFMAQVGALGSAWEGAAATAAVQDAHNTRKTFLQIHESSARSSSASKQYYDQAKSDQERSKAIPNVDDSWGHAIVTGAPGGIVGIGAAKLVQHQKYQKAHQQAVEIADRMDSAGRAQADTMRAQSWPSGSTNGGSPPSSLPPVPGSGGRSGGISGNYNASPHGGGPGSRYSMPVGPTATNPNDSEILDNGVGPHNGGKNPNPQTTTTTGTTTAPTSVTVPQDSDIATTGGLTPGGTPTEAVPSTPGVTGAGAAAVGVLGGAGLVGAGALGAGAPAGAGRGGALAEGDEAALRGRAGAPAEADRTGVRGGAFGEGDGALRPGMRGASGLGGSADEELGARRGSYLRGSAPDGFMGEPVAGEAGRLGGYPGGGARAARRNDEEEAPVPDYLVETEDVWGDGVTAAPPVIGE